MFNAIKFRSMILTYSKFFHPWDFLFPVESPSLVLARNLRAKEKNLRASKNLKSYIKFFFSLLHAFVYRISYYVI